MKKKIWLDNERFIACDVSTEFKVDVYTFDCKDRRKELVEAMINNGFSILNADDVNEDWIEVRRDRFVFLGETYCLNQCSDLFEWFGDSQVGEFTYYYSHLVFHHTDGRFYSADIEDTSNYIQI